MSAADWFVLAAALPQPSPGAICFFISGKLQSGSFVRRSGRKGTHRRKKMLKLSEKHTLFFRFSVVKSSNPRFGDFVVLHSPFSLFAPLFFSSFIPAGSRAGVVLGQENSNLLIILNMGSFEGMQTAFCSNMLGN